MHPLSTVAGDSAIHAVTRLSVSIPQYWLSWCQETKRGERGSLIHHWVPQHMMSGPMRSSTASSSRGERISSASQRNSRWDRAEPLPPSPYAAAELSSAARVAAVSFGSSTLTGA